jgi:hypothetical protein
MAKIASSIRTLINKEILTINFFIKSKETFVSSKAKKPRIIMKVLAFYRELESIVAEFLYHLRSYDQFSKVLIIVVSDLFYKFFLLIAKYLSNCSF